MPTWENIQFAMELLESALNIRCLLTTITQILGMLRPLVDQPLLLNKRGYHLIQSMAPTVMLICVGLLR